jgi:hypothetical protein
MVTLYLCVFGRPGLGATYVFCDLLRVELSLLLLTQLNPSEMMATETELQR